MEKIISVREVFELPKHGLVVCGSNPVFDKLDKSSIIDFIGSRVEAHLTNQKVLSLSVKNIDVMVSIIGNKNICLNFNEVIDKAILEEATIYKVR